VLTAQVDKLGKDIDAALGSLAALPRVKADRVPPPWLADADWGKKDAATRAAARRKWADELVAATTKAPETGFKAQKAKYWTVVSNSDPGFTKKVITAAEAGRDWLSKKLPDLTKEPPLPAVLRIFDSNDQYQAFLTIRNRGDTREYDATSRELYCVNDRDNGGPTGFGPVLRAVFWQICDDVDPGVLPALPRWFDQGCAEFLRSSHFDGKKLEFASGDVEKGRMQHWRQNNTPIPNLWDIMQEKIQPSPTDGSSEKDWGYTPESSRLMRWFWMNDGQKAFDKPNLVTDYVRALAAAYGKSGPDPTANVALAVLTDAERKELNNRHYKWRDALLVAVNDIAVPLQVEVWKAVNEKWVQWNATFK
jgi:hypothetical protein